MTKKQWFEADKAIAYSHKIARSEMLIRHDQERDRVRCEFKKRRSDLFAEYKTLLKPETTSSFIWRGKNLDELSQDDKKAFFDWYKTSNCGFNELTCVEQSLFED